MLNIDLDLKRFKPFLKGKIVKASTSNSKDQPYIWGLIRKKWLIYQPEELIRQLLIQYLIQEKKYPKNFIQVERLLTLHSSSSRSKQLSKRTDILVFDRNMHPFLMVECKAPEVKMHIDLTKDGALWQSTTYLFGQQTMEVPYLLISNGLQSYCCQRNIEKQELDFLDKIPSFP